MNDTASTERDTQPDSYAELANLPSSSIVQEIKRLRSRIDSLGQSYETKTNALSNDFLNTSAPPVKVSSRDLKFTFFVLVCANIIFYVIPSSQIDRGFLTSILFTGASALVLYGVAYLESATGVYQRIPNEIRNETFIARQEIARLTEQRQSIEKSYQAHKALARKPLSIFGIELGSAWTYDDIKLRYAHAVKSAQFSKSDTQAARRAQDTLKAFATAYPSTGEISSALSDFDRTARSVDQGLPGKDIKEDEQVPWVPVSTTIGAAIAIMATLDMPSDHAVAGSIPEELPIENRPTESLADRLRLAREATREAAEETKNAYYEFKRMYPISNVVCFTYKTKKLLGREEYTEVTTKFLETSKTNYTRIPFDLHSQHWCRINVAGIPSTRYPDQTFWSGPFQ